MGKEGVHKELALPLSTLSLAKLILARVVEALRGGHARLLSANSLVSGGRAKANSRGLLWPLGAYRGVSIHRGPAWEMSSWGMA